MDDIPSVEELSSIILETVRRNDFHEDVYIRPSFYKSTRAIRGVRLHHLEHQLYVTIPFGNYIDTGGVRLMTSSWRRNADEQCRPAGRSSAAT